MQEPANHAVSHQQRNSWMFRGTNSQAPHSQNIPPGSFVRCNALCHLAPPATVHRLATEFYLNKTPLMPLKCK